MTVVGIVLISIGFVFLAVSAVGTLRFPDFYTRAHAVSKSETVGLIFVFGGLFFHPALDWGSAARLAFVLVFSVLANPTAVHALARAARRSSPVAKEGTRS